MPYTVGITLTPSTIAYLRTLSAVSLSDAVRISVSMWDMNVKALEEATKTTQTTCTLDDSSIERVRFAADKMGVKEGKALRLILEHPTNPRRRETDL